MSDLTLRRLAGEMRLLEQERESCYQVVQDPDDKFKFYFMIRGDPDTAYKGGYYIGRIEVPADYPKNPGNFYMLTPSGRFKTGSKICLTNSGYHRETWSPMWNINNMVMTFLSIFSDDNTSGISHIKDTVENRKRMAADSAQYNLTNLAAITEMFDQFVKEDKTFRTYGEVDQYIKDLLAERSRRKDEEKAAKKAKRDAKKAKKAAKKEAKRAKRAAQQGETKETQPVKTEIIETEIVETETVEMETVDAETVDAETVDAETVDAETVETANATTTNKDEESDEEEEDEADQDDKNDEEVDDEEDENVEEKQPKTPIVKAVSNTRVRPKNRDEWNRMVDDMTLSTFDPEILSMVF